MNPPERNTLAPNKYLYAQNSYIMMGVRNDVLAPEK